jgi:TonB family protein
MNVTGASEAGPTAGAAPPAGAGQEKVLRACVVQGGRILEEQRIPRRQPLSIGTSSKNTFVLPDPTLPKSHQLFGVRGDGYELILTEDMKGRLQADDADVVDFATLKQQGVLKKKGAYYHMPLTDSHRGKVQLGDITIIFQFMVPPVAPARVEVPLLLKGNFKERIDWVFTGALLAVFMVEAPLTIAIQFANPPSETTIENLDERWAKIIVPERKELPKPKAEEQKQASDEPKKQDAKKDEAKKDKPDAEAQAKAKAARRETIREKVAGKGILAILGTAGQGTGAVADVFGEGGGVGDLDSAFEGISGVGLATGGDRSTRGAGSGEAASIGGLATAGGGKVGLGGKTEARVAAVKAEAPEVDGSLDPSAIADIVRKRLRSIQDCYEKELKRDSSLQGKIEIEFTIGSTGAVEDARVSSNKMGSDAVGDCIVSRVRRWRFPQPDGGSVTVNYPFIFTPSS